jgi:hypothetical protein
MFRMDEGRARFIDAATKILAVIAVAAGGGWTLYTYLNGRADIARTASLEARKPFEEKRLELYIEAATVTAKIARSHDKNEVARAKDEFWVLYLGPLALVEDEEVEGAMFQFGKCLNPSAKCKSMLEALSLEVAHQCKDSLSATWGVPRRPTLSVRAQ